MGTGMLIVPMLGTSVGKYGGQELVTFSYVPVRIIQRGKSGKRHATSLGSPNLENYFRNGTCSFVRCSRAETRVETTQLLLN